MALLMGGAVLGCQGPQEVARCPEFRLEVCIQALAQSQAAYQAGWFSPAYTWSEVRRATLAGCGCDSAAFDKAFQQYFSKHPEKLERIYEKALSGLSALSVQPQP